nr:MAG TPA: hypothetical protein [Caudoviricetes sp.]
MLFACFLAFFQSCHSIFPVSPYFLRLLLIELLKL